MFTVAYPHNNMPSCYGPTLLPNSALASFSLQSTPVPLSSGIPYQVPSSSSVSSVSSGSSKGYQLSDEFLLPEDFVPSPYSVVCGRGRRAMDAVGNRRLQVITQMYTKRYLAANKKDEKSLIVTEIFECVKAACSDSRHAFVRYSNGRWFRVQSLNAREKIGTVLRDVLHSKYKSSTKSKLEKRRKLRKQGKNALPGSTPEAIEIAKEDQLSDEDFDSFFA